MLNLMTILVLRVSMLNRVVSRQNPGLSVKTATATNCDIYLPTAKPLLSGHQLECQFFPHIYCKLNLLSADTSVNKVIIITH